MALAGGVGRLEDDGTVAVLDQPYPGLAELLADGASLADVAAAPARLRLPYGENLTSPLGTGTAVWGIGLNYSSKQAATGRGLPEHPVLFLKAPSASTGTTIPVPWRAPDRVDYEGEIAVVIGRHVVDAPAPVALRSVAGVIAANDVTARDVMRNTGSPSLAKSFPGFGQFGPVLADPECIGGWEGMELRTFVNGDLQQQDVSSGMILAVGDLLSLISRYAALRPGDIVLTGTPAGTGEERGRYLSSGDVVEVVIGHLPALCSRVVDRRGGDQTGAASRREV